MLHAFRESVGKYVAIAILALIGVTFIFFGIDFSVTRSPFAAKVNGENISMLEFDRQLQQMQTQYQQAYRLELTDDLRRDLRRTVIDQMVMSEALRQQTVGVGYRVGDDRLAQSIRETPAFQAGGEFSSDIYRAQLSNVGLTPAVYEAMQRDQLALYELQDGLVASTFWTPAEYRRYIELYNERREVAYAVFSADAFVDQIEVSDEEVAAYYETNQSLFMTEEAVDLEYIELSLADVAATLEITEEDLRAYYEAERDALATTEERHVRHILITPEGDDYAEAEAEANAALARIEAGEDFATVAAEVSDDAGTRNAGGDLGWMTRGVLVGPFEDTLFEMEVGDVAGPVETEFGFHVLMLEDVRRGDVQSFEMVRDDLLAQLSTEEASGVFFDRANQLADAAFDAFDELASAAEAVGLPLETVQGFTRSNEQGLFENSPAAIAAAFDDDAIVSGENSALLELTDDDVAVLRVVAHHDPEPRPLDEVSDEIRETLALQGGSELARTQALEFVAAIEQGVDDIGALAAEQGATWTEATWFQRTAPETPQAILAAAFAVPAVAGAEPVVQQVPLGNGDEAVILVSAVERGDPERLPVAERDQRLSQLADQAAQQEMIGYAAGVRERASVRVPDEVLEPQF